MTKHNSQLPKKVSLPNSIRSDPKYVIPPGRVVQIQEQFSTLSTPNQLELILHNCGFTGTHGVYSHPDAYLQRIDPPSSERGRTYFAIEGYVSQSKIDPNHPIRVIFEQIREPIAIGIASTERVVAYFGVRSKLSP